MCALPPTRRNAAARKANVAWSTVGSSEVNEMEVDRRQDGIDAEPSMRRNEESKIPDEVRH